MLKSIDHPNVLKLYECYQDSFNYYLVTEYCKGGELIHYILENKFISEVKASYIMKQVLSAIAYCHQNRIVHRDLKAENLLIKNIEGQDKINIKVIDFGISCKLEP